MCESLDAASSTPAGGDARGGTVVHTRVLVRDLPAPRSCTTRIGHLLLLCPMPTRSCKVRNAGAIFLGHWRRAFGDYGAREPRAADRRTARFSSGLRARLRAVSSGVRSITERRRPLPRLDDGTRKARRPARAMDARGGSARSRRVSDGTEPRAGVRDVEPYVSPSSTRSRA